MVPVAQHAQPLEILHLQRDLLGRVGAAAGLHLVARQVAPVFLFDRVLDRQAVAVPAGNVRRVQPLELACLDHHVLENLVDRMPHVDLAVGVRRAVVQHELFVAAAGGAQLLVQALVIPLLDPTRLALGQVTAHRKRGVGEVEGGSVIGLGIRHCKAFGCHPGLDPGSRMFGEENGLRSPSAMTHRVKFGRAWSGDGWRRKRRALGRSPSRCRFSRHRDRRTSARRAVCAAVPPG